MLLGDVLGRLNDDGEAAEIILAAGDLRMLTAMQEHAKASGLDLAAFARAALQHYAAEATDEEWVTLMGQMGRTSDPGLVCLKRAFENALRV